MEVRRLTAENRKATVCLCNVVDKFLNQYCLADTSATEKANLATTGIRSKEVNHFNTSFQYLSSRRLINERWRIGVYGLASNTFNRTTLVYGFANDVHDATKCLTTNGDFNGGTGVHDLLATNETLSTIHGDCTDRILAQMGSDLENKATTAEILDLESIENWGKVVSLKLNVNNGTNDSLDMANNSL